MTANEFRARHKRLFVALEAYGWKPFCSSLISPSFTWFNSSYGQWWRFIAFDFEKSMVFHMWGVSYPDVRYKKESSVLAALAKIHAGQMP